MKKLNLGSIVEIKSSEKKVMVIAYNKRDEKGDIQRYEAIEYPKGIKEEKLYYFVDEDIVKVIDKGYDSREIA